MRFVSWNVNGIRAILKKNFEDVFSEMDADFFSVQEIKCQEGQVDLNFPGYYSYWNYAERKGYSGVAVFTKHQPNHVYYGLGIPELDTEGRLITLEYDNFYHVTCYTPNAQSHLKRLEHRLIWEKALLEYLEKLDAKKPVIYCGDLNVAHKEIDLKNDKMNHGNPGFSDEERERMSILLDHGFIDTFRYFYPDLEHVYSWWSYRHQARKTNAGWRIDYFITSQSLASKLVDAKIHDDIMGSDHCPVSLEINWEK
ncbi:exodeoxyribonuclease III [Aerococcus suis]|uniref:Exodeoxyribonuclease-3 n=1 Tax=Aerococcus suis TaxID=371602 RepID=A0A1W1Y1V1_9LACT|nr:exodeoxyribonuclease III [Aerococcus suis]SMC30190.1 exodeoxyribonuclease-3 [Aerococcus suis]